MRGRSYLRRLAAVAFTAAGLALLAPGGRVWAGQTAWACDPAKEVKRVHSGRRANLSPYQARGDPKDLYGEGSGELADLIQALEGIELPSALPEAEPEETEKMEKITDPPMTFVRSETGGMLDYTLPQGSRFSASVPRGMTVTDPVSFKPVEHSIVTVKRNGSGMETSGDGVYRQPGNYHIRMLILPGASGGDSRFYEVNFYFTILPKEVSMLNLLTAPEGFVIEKVELEGRELKADNSRWHFLQEDGRYRVRFSREKGGLSYDISFNRDTQAPLLAISPVLDRREMKEAVYLEPTEDMASIEMHYNGRIAPIPVKRLELAGLYQFHLKDRAGNERYYEIRMGERLRPPSAKVIIITLIGVGTAAGWFFYQRRHPRFL